MDQSDNVEASFPSSGETVYEACGTADCISGCRILHKRALFHHSHCHLNQSLHGGLEHRESMDLDGTDEKSESYYFASLFGKCDPEKTGRVKVSVLMSTLRELQALASDSCETDSGENAALMELKEELDPNDDDPEITLHKFSEGFTAYLQKSNKGNIEPDDDDFLLDSRSHETKTEAAKEPIKIKLFANSDAELLQTQVSDLKLQLQKLTDDNLVLKSHARAAQDENSNILQALENRTLELKSQAERIKRLEREVDDKTEIICSLEGRNAALCNKFSQLTNDLSVFHKERKKLMTEKAHLKEELEKTSQLLTTKEELISKQNSEVKLAEVEWKNKEKSLNDRIGTLNRFIEELNEKVKELELEYSKLKEKTTKKLMLHTANSYAEELAASGTLEESTFYSMGTTLSPSEHSVQVSFSGEHYENILLNAEPISDFNIKMEMIEAGESHIMQANNHSYIERFDAATQCEDEYLNLEVSEINSVVNVQYCTSCSKLIEEMQFMKDQKVEDQQLIQRYLVAEPPPTENLNGVCSQKKLPSWNYRQILANRSPCVWFLVILIIFGLAVLTPMDDGCLTNPFIFKGAENFFKFCGQLTHDRVPII